MEPYKNCTWILQEKMQKKLSNNQTLFQPKANPNLILLFNSDFGWTAFHITLKMLK